MPQAEDPKPLRLDRVSIRLHDHELVGIDAAIAPGQVLTVMGESGSGKSTLLAFVAGFLEPVFTASGRVLLGEDEITSLPPHERRTGLLFQDAMLFPHMSVGENLLFALPRGDARSARIAAVNNVLADAGLEGFFDRDPATLSGGQKARVALARTLLSKPRALLLDEPFSKLDASRRQTIRRHVFDTAKAVGLPVLLVTHDRADAEAAGGPVFDLDDQ